MRKTQSPILDAVYETAKGLNKAGVMDQVTQREFDRLCWPSLKAPEHICKHTEQYLSAPPSLPITEYGDLRE